MWEAPMRWQNSSWWERIWYTTLDIWAFGEAVVITLWYYSWSSVQNISVDMNEKQTVTFLNASKFMFQWSLSQSFLRQTTLLRTTISPSHESLLSRWWDTWWVDLRSTPHPGWQSPPGWHYIYSLGIPINLYLPVAYRVGTVDPTSICIICLTASGFSRAPSWRSLSKDWCNLKLWG